MAILFAVVTPTVAAGDSAVNQSSLAADPAMAANLDQLEAEQRAYEDWLQSPEAVTARQQSQTAYESLSDSEALDLLTKRFGDLVKNDSSFPVQAGQVVGYDGDHAAVVNSTPAASLTNGQNQAPTPDEQQANGSAVVNPGDPSLVNPPASSTSSNSSDTGSSNAGPSLVESTLPLRVVDAAGAEAPVDLGLEDRGDSFSPKNPIVDASLPKTLGQGLGAGGIGVQLPGTDSARQGVRLGPSSLVYPNIADARDLVASVQPTGIELSTEIRSLDAAESERYVLNLPPGAELKPAEDGSLAIVAADGQLLGRVDRPTAVDAQGQQIPVSIQPDSSSSFIVKAGFHGGDYALPLLIDPVIETYQSGGFGTTLWPIVQTAGSPFVVCPGPDSSCWSWTVPFVSAPTGSYPAGAGGEKIWWEPNAVGNSNPDSTTAWVQSVTFSNVTYSGNPAQSLTPYFVAGIWNPRTSGWNAYQFNDGTQSFSNQNFTLTPTGTPPGPIDDGQAVFFALADWTSAATSHTGAASAYDSGGVTISTTDPEAPTDQAIQNNTIPTTWINSGGPYSLSLPATDPGLGVSKEWMFLPVKVGGTIDLGEPNKYASQIEQSPGCLGTRPSPCPQSWTGNFSISSAQVNAMPEGRSKIYFWSMDPLGSVFAQENGTYHIGSSSTEIRVDRSGPQLTLSNTLADAAAAGDELDAKPYDLHILARDGSTQSPDLERSGVHDIKLYLNDTAGTTTPVAQWSNTSCPGSSCEGTLDYTLHAENLSPGRNTLTIISTDWTGGTPNKTTKTLDFTVKGHAGVILTPKAGDTTARKFGLQAERHDPTMTNVTFQYKRPGVSTAWHDIPTNRLTLDSDGSNPTSTSLVLDQNGKSPLVTWDVPPTTPDINGTDGKINVRAKFTGPGSPTVPDPMLFWRLGESDPPTAYDSSGNDNQGTYVGGPLLNQAGALSRPGAPFPQEDDGAVSLNGSSQYVLAANSPFGAATTQTFAGWALRNSSNTPDILVGGNGQTSSPNPPGWTDSAPTLMINDASTVWWNAGTSDANSTNPTASWANAWPGTGVWVHWALVFNQSTGAAELFINGQSKGVQYIDSWYANPGSFVLGARLNIDGNMGSFFDGKLDEVAIYNTGLTPTEIQGLYNGTGGSNRGFSQVVPLTLDRDTTSSKHASAPIGPGALDLQTGNFSVTADDVKINGWGSDLTFSRTFNSRAPGQNIWGGMGLGWVMSLPVDAAGSDYIQLNETGPAGDPSAAITITTSDSTSIMFSRGDNGAYKVEPMYTGLELSADGAGNYVLKDIDGSTTTFYKPNWATAFVPQKATQTGSAGQNTTQYGYEQSGTTVRPTFAVAPTPAGVSCTTTDQNGNLQLVASPPPGCRWLTFSYTGSNVPPVGSYGPFSASLDHITFHAWKPGDSAATAVDVAQYDYDHWGRLHAEWDPRISPALKTTYSYDANTTDPAHLQTVTPPGQNPWTFTYNPAQSGDDPNTGRLATVARNVPGVGNATTTVNYSVSLSSPWSMTPSSVAQWHQSDLPAQATAIIPPNPTTGAAQSDLTKATIYYMNRNGNLVNRANPTSNSQGEISTIQYDSHRNVISQLTPQNRLLALAAGANASATADVLETDTVYSTDGVDPLETFGPEHQVQLADGSLVQARQHAVTTFDEGRPTGQDYHLPTTQIVGARVCSGLSCPTTSGSASDVETRTTQTAYNWALRQPTQVTVDPGTGSHLNLVSKTSYDQASGLVTQSSSPLANTAGTDAHTTKTIYYSAQGQSPDSACQNKPEWANLPCKTMPAGQPTGVAPNLPTTSYQYDIWGDPTTVTDTVPGSGETRTATSTYDGAGRPLTAALSATGSNVGTAVPTVTTAYDPNTGLTTTTSSSAGTITRGYDAVGRQTSYTDADGVQSTTQYANLNGPTSLTDGKGTTTFTYDSTTGRVATMSDSQAGAFSAAYNGDGALTSETMPNGLTLQNSYDSTGAPISRSYTMGALSLMQFTENQSIQGQVTSQTTSTSGAVTETDTEVYDAAGRLLQSRDSTPTGGCSTQNYSYDGDSNRSAQRSVAAIPGGACDSNPNDGTLTSHSYDEADRLLNSGSGNNYTYDAFGRALSVPAVDAGGTALTATYYINDRVRSMTQGSVTKTYTDDPLGRIHLTQTSGQSDQLDHFSSDSDSPSWTLTGASNWTRYVAGIDGALSAVQQGSGGTNGTLTYELTNIHGDVVGETNSLGVLGSTFKANEFGVPQGSQPSSGYGWLGGKERKAQFASGITTMGQRVYVPQLGRFLQTDPVPGGSANAYDYVNQDPLDQIDCQGTVAYVGPYPGAHPGLTPPSCAGSGPKRGRVYPAEGDTGSYVKTRMRRGKVVWSVHATTSRQDPETTPAGFHISTYLNGKKTSSGFNRPAKLTYMAHGSVPGGKGNDAAQGSVFRLTGVITYPLIDGSYGRIDIDISCVVP